ncbi:hypothetical protein BDV27DRAFT_162888 [Aspergillus caelatus]|uniref:ATP-grasp domain-containing protein n=1 Tax=Aspergillus caelatus TaxID=61420 RepID=A0A5N6ZNG9_9EURO|nr:uncharacterized protein BDV27DRAFT_162888 [Aspergillus caelatus]KAE8359164.1 hypothetical protein BDV27DRAFT_162888 [Aspergillus caelatus]
MPRTTFSNLPKWLISQYNPTRSVTSLSPEIPPLPSVNLDITLAGLFREHGIADPIVIDIYNGYTHFDVHPQILRETIYTQDEDVGLPDNSIEALERFRNLALTYKTVKFLLALGPVDVFLYSPVNAPAQIERILSPLPVHQRPQVHYIDLNQQDIQEQLEQVTHGKKLWYYRPKSYMLQQDTLVSPDFAYTINDKRFLLHPSIPTPDLEMVSLQSEDLSTSVFTTRPLPFVVKLRRCSGSQGTWVVTSEDEREIMLAAMKQYRSRGVPEVQISEFIHSTQPHYSVNFFIGAPGPSNESAVVTFLGATEQVFSITGRWAGGIIDYQSQESIKERLMGTINAVASTMIGSYVGWVGIDVIIHERNNRTVVVDLNARLTGGFVLCLLSGHFMEERGLPFAQAKGFHYEGQPADVYTRLATFIRTGQVTVAAVTETLPNNCTTQLIFGGRNREELADMKGIIQETLNRRPDIS